MTARRLVWSAGVIVAVLGYSLPRIYVFYRGRERMAQIERGLPTAIDMLTLCLSAGLNVLNSLDRVPSSRRETTLLNKFKHQMVDPIKWVDESAKWEKLFAELFMK